MVFTAAHPFHQQLPDPRRQTSNPVTATPVSRAALIASAVAGLVGAVFWRIDESGLGTTVTGILILALVIASADEDFRNRQRWYWIPLSAGIAALLAVPLFLDADWVGGICLFVAICASLLLFLRAHNLVGVWVAALSPAIAPLFALVEPFRRRPTAAATATTRRARIRLGLLALVVAAVTVVLLLIFGALFAGADPTFGKLFDIDLSNPLSADVVTAIFAGLFIAWVALTGALLTRVEITVGTESGARSNRRYPPVWAWGVPIGALLALFLLFLVMQARALFGGDDYVQRTANLTYSQYAVRGFWQLLVVTLLVIVVATAAWWFIDRDDAGQRRTARILLGGLCAATLLVVVSAFLRMERYINAYGATRDRVFGLYFEVFLAAVIVALIAVGIRFDARPLVRRVILLTVFSALGFALLNPDHLIAKTNIDRASSAQKVDAWYLGSLSADAYRQIQRLPEPARSCAVWRLQVRQPIDPSWRDFNVSRNRLPARPVDGSEPPGCGAFRD